MLKATKNQGFTLSLENTLLEKPNGVGVKLTPSRLRVNFRFNFTTIRQLLSAPHGKTIAIFATSMCILQILPLSFANLPFGIILTFLNNILRAISTLSSLLRLNQISGMQGKCNSLQTACTGTFCFFKYLLYVKQIIMFLLAI